jgi:hypothetical protein
MTQKTVKSSHKDVNRLLRACAKANIPVRKTGGQHYVIYVPDGTMMNISASPRNSSQMEYVLSKLRKKGIDI